ncbi:MAG: DUF547 domain-containing protein [Candidatus Polarisedimenticolaceae bacterium]|nr:DUF547 domain-containing protein [Candidatus Polarisedimenticolaceae bacterium]
MRHILWSLMVGLLLASQSLSAAPKADLWPLWQQNSSQGGEQVDHSAWQKFLDDYLQMGSDGITRLDYAAVGSSGHEVLLRYLSMLQRTPVFTLSREQQRAYWINLYNAGTVSVILEHYPVASIRDIDISPGWFLDGPWDKKLFKIAGQDVTLNDIEHRILRPIWQDARLHYALNCASIGCPNLQQRVFTVENSERLLDQAAIAFINHKRAVSVVNGELELSSIYHWFNADFGGDDSAIIHHLKRFAKPALAAKLREVEEIEGHQYDWSLNEVVKK